MCCRDNTVQILPDSAECTLSPAPWKRYVYFLDKDIILTNFHQNPQRKSPRTSSRTLLNPPAIPAWNLEKFRPSWTLKISALIFSLNSRGKLSNREINYKLMYFKMKHIENDLPPLSRKSDQSPYLPL